MGSPAAPSAVCLLCGGQSQEREKRAHLGTLDFLCQVHPSERTWMFLPWFSHWRVEWKFLPHPAA